MRWAQHSQNDRVGQQIAATVSAASFQLAKMSYKNQKEWIAINVAV